MSNVFLSENFLFVNGKNVPFERILQTYMIYKYSLIFGDKIIEIQKLNQVLIKNLYLNFCHLHFLKMFLRKYTLIETCAKLFRRHFICFYKLQMFLLQF